MYIYNMDDFPRHKTCIWFGDFPATLDHQRLSDAV